MARRKIKLPKKRFKIILADPPWNYRDKASAGKRGASFKYSTMSLIDILGLHVQDISGPNCALFLWVTMPFLDEGLWVLERWGFEYKTVAFTWVKKTPLGKQWHWGMGHYTRANAEVCLLGIKGKLKRRCASVHSVVDTPVEKHSRKPAIVRKRIVELLGPLSRIELFATEKVKGWNNWGKGSI